jgi:hypothetical protein
MVDTTEMVRFRVRVSVFVYDRGVRERERKEQGDLSVALVLWAQNRRFRGVWWHFFFQDLWVHAFNGGIERKEYGASSRFNRSQGA